MKAAYIEEFIGQDGRIEPDKQASYVRVLAFDLAPEELKPAIVEHLVRLVRAAGTHIGTGFLSTAFLCHVLSENGRLDVAYDLLTQKTIPSWLYAVTKGATTIWESWEGIKEDGTPQLSLNHYSPGPWPTSCTVRWRGSRPPSRVITALPSTRYRAEG